MDTEGLPIVVIDHGSELCKAGFAGSDFPSSIFHSVIGRPQQALLSNSDEYVGDSAYSKRGMLDITCPIQNGVITNWNDLEKLWEYALYTDLKCYPPERTVLLTDSPSTSKSQRRKMAEVMFENLQVHALYIANQAELALHACGRQTGVVLDCGSEVTHALPILEGYSLSHGIQRSDFGGKNITEYLQHILLERGYNFVTSRDKELVQDITETLGYVSLDFEDEMQKSYLPGPSGFERPYKLPDGKLITIGNERFRCTETLFQPCFMGLECCGIHEMIYNSIMKGDSDIRRELLSNIVVVGGSSLFPGFQERLQKELTALVPTKFKISVTVPRRRYASWIGGSMLVSEGYFQHKWITKEQYEEVGPEIIQ